MPRFFFNLDDSRPIEDHSGEELCDLEAAKAIASMIIKQFRETEIAEKMPGNWHIVVTDENGDVVHRAYPVTQ